jgi:hypothetical protein
VKIVRCARLKCRSTNLTVHEEPLPSGACRLYYSCLECGRQRMIYLSARTYRKWKKFVERG